jgi:hypothetical protein
VPAHLLWMLRVVVQDEVGVQAVGEEAAAAFRWVAADGWEVAL